ncbi:hypothetical protein EDD85DRAFT_941792 [Armillaria nabsnona]|nr:hypothetical protein EDD85DRAFT_941792 [Armillaria nabsnona]
MRIIWIFDHRKPTLRMVVSRIRLPMMTLPSNTLNAYPSTPKTSLSAPQIVPLLILALETKAGAREWMTWIDWCGGYGCSSRHVAHRISISVVGRILQTCYQKDPLHEVILPRSVCVTSVYGRKTVIEILFKMRKELVGAEMIGRVPEEGVLRAETRYADDDGFFARMESLIFRSQSWGRNAARSSDRKSGLMIGICELLYSKREAIPVEEVMVL